MECAYSHVLCTYSHALIRILSSRYVNIGQDLPNQASGLFKDTVLNRTLPCRWETAVEASDQRLKISVCINCVHISPVKPGLVFIQLFFFFSFFLCIQMSKTRLLLHWLLRFEKEWVENAKRIRIWSFHIFFFIQNFNNIQESKCRMLALQWLLLFLKWRIGVYMVVSWNVFPSLPSN
jgi:hypothetical protein